MNKDKYDSIINEPINPGHDYKYFLKKFNLKVYKGSPRVVKKAKWIPRISVGDSFYRLG